MIIILHNYLINRRSFCRRIDDNSVAEGCGGDDLTDRSSIDGMSIAVSVLRYRISSIEVTMSVGDPDGNTVSQADISSGRIAPSSILALQQVSILVTEIYYTLYAMNAISTTNSYYY